MAYRESNLCFCVLVLQGVDPTSVKSSLSPEGVLSIGAPKKEAANLEERHIAIELDGSGDENHCYVVKMQK